MYILPTFTVLFFSLNSKIEPLFEKILSASDASRIGRLVLPKACAEVSFPLFTAFYVCSDLLNGYSLSGFFLSSRVISLCRHIFLLLISQKVFP